MEERRQNILWFIVTTLLQNKHLLFRMFVTIGVLALLFYIIRMLMHYQIASEHKEILIAIIGAIIANYGKVIDWWFHQSDNTDKESKSSSS